MTDRASLLADRFLDSVVGAGLRKCASVPAESTRYARYSPEELKAEAIRLQPLTGMGKRECVRAFGDSSLPWETGRDWLDAGQPKKRPPAEFVEFLFHRAAARSFVRVA